MRKRMRRADLDDKGREQHDGQQECVLAERGGVVRSLLMCVQSTRVSRIVDGT